jgi:hypothetical protein
VSRRRFEHLMIEISLAVGVRINRYALWLALHEQGMDPETLSREDALRFCDEPLWIFLAERGLELAAKPRRRLLREVARFDPSQPTPEELFSALSRS